MLIPLLLQDKVETLILMAVKDCGIESVENVMSLIMESLTIKEAEQTRAFLKWAFFDWENRCFGHGNYDARYEQWRTGIAGKKPHSTKVFPKTGKNRFHQYHWTINCRCGGKMRGSFGKFMVESHVEDVRKFCKEHESCKEVA